MMSFAVLVILKATLVCGAAFIIARICRRARASIRHLLFAFAFAALIVIPAAGPVLPAVTMRLPASRASSIETPPDTGRLVQSSVAPRAGKERAQAIAQTAPAGLPLTISQMVVILWFVGAALSMLPMLAGVWQVRRLRRTAIPWTDGRGLMHPLVAAGGLRRNVDVVLHDAVPGPLTCGVLRPSIILPVTARNWDEISLRRTLRHELHHVARWDLLMHCVARVICAAYWFHPLVWASWRRLRLEAEKACDDAVVREDDARDYAMLLVSLAQPAVDAKPPLLAMASRDDLSARVAALLDDRQPRGPVGRRRAAGLLVTAAAVVCAVAPISVARAMPQAQVTPASSSADFAIASIKRYPPSEIRQFDGRITATSVTVRELLIAAYGVRDVENAPLWVRADRFDIAASGPPEGMPPRSREPKSLQAFLTERFKLRAHQRERDFPVYALVLARPDGRLGPQLTPSQQDCSRRDSIRARAVSGAVPAADAAAPNCSTSSSDGRLAGGGVTLEEFAKNLPMHLRSYGSRQAFDRQLVDRTGLAGRFDFRLEWEQDMPANEPSAPGRPFVSVLESAVPRFLAALQQQLGLRIESQMAPSPILVIDSIEPPVEQ